MKRLHRKTIFYTLHKHKKEALIDWVAEDKVLKVSLFLKAGKLQLPKGENQTHDKVMRLEFSTDFVEPDSNA